MDGDPGPTFSLHPDSGWLLLDGAELPLQYKAQAVLARLVRSAPARVSREELIDSIWDGNYLTGVTGVPQAIRSIRLALGDNATEPMFIRTFPPASYQWLGRSPAPAVRDGDVVPAGATAPRRSPGAFAVAVLIVALAVANWLAVESSLQREEPRISRAELRYNAIFVDYATGCQRVLVPNDHDLLVGSPIISADRRQVVFHVQKDGDCRMINVEPALHRAPTFDRCADVRT